MKHTTLRHLAPYPGLLFAALLPAALNAQIVLVETGHTLIPRVNSALALHPSQQILDTTLPLGEIESIAIDPVSRDLFVQLIVPPRSAPSTSTHVFRVNAGNAVTPVALNTGLGINERGADMHFDTVTGNLVTMDDATVPARIVTISQAGVIGVYSIVNPPIFGGGTFGMDFSLGMGGSVVPPGDIVFTGDLVAAGVHSVTATLPFRSVTHVPGSALPGGGDDLVIQPDGDWIWIGDFTNPITQISPRPPHILTPSTLNLATMFATAGLPFIAGSRAAVCDVTGDIYVSFSSVTGGTGVFRVDESLTRATLVMTIGGATGTTGLHDLVVGPSSNGPGTSLYFTVHDQVTGGEEVWEWTTTVCCPSPATTALVPDTTGVNAPRSLLPFPSIARPTLGNTNFRIAIDDLARACPITFGSPSYLMVDFAPGSIFFPSYGCLPGSVGEFQVALAAPLFLGPVTWAGPGIGAIHRLPIPFASGLCGARIYLQGLWLDATGPSGPIVLTTRVDLTLGS